MIGKGMFSKVYKINEKEVVILTNDNSKECLATFCQGGTHVPKIERLEDIGDFQAYRMPLYFKLTTKSKQAWAQYKILKNLFSNNRDFPEYTGFEIAKERLEACADLPDSVKEDIGLILDNMAMYTAHIFFDIVPRNMMVDELGNLILIDIIGDSKELEKAWEKKHSRSSRFL